MTHLLLVSLLFKIFLYPLGYELTFSMCLCAMAPLLLQPVPSLVSSSLRWGHDTATNVQIAFLLRFLRCVLCPEVSSLLLCLANSTHLCVPSSRMPLSPSVLV